MDMVCTGDWLFSLISPVHPEESQHLGPACRLRAAGVQDEDDEPSTSDAAGIRRPQRRRRG